MMYPREIYKRQKFAYIEKVCLKLFYTFSKE